MQNLMVFKNEDFGEVRTLLINDEPWFIGKDVAEALGYSNSRNAVPKHVSKEDSLRTQIEYAGQRREVTIINESGLYALIFGSKLESAQKFKRWVTSEVLPAIRKTGQYNIKDSYMIKDPIERAKRWIEEQEEKQALIAENAELKPKALFAEAVSASKGSVSVGTLAKMLTRNGIVIGQNRLYTWLRDNGYLIKDGRNKNVAVQRFVEGGLFELKENITYSDDNVPIIRKPTTMVTGKGQKYFINKFLKLEEKGE